MRFLHTADWHLCDRLGRIDRTSDLRTRVERVSELCLENAVDVLLIAGDLFSHDASIDEMTESLEHMSGVFGEFFDRGGTILAVTGNHDREARVGLVRQGMRLASPQGGNALRAGRMYLRSEPLFGILQTDAGEKAQVALMPYPTIARFQLPTEEFCTKDEEHRRLNQAIVNWLNLEAKPKVDPKLPSVLVGHLHVAGAGLSHTLFRITEQDDVVLDQGGLGLDWLQYVALGHIHKPQALGGMNHVRYSGSLDRLDFGERDDEKGVVLFDLGASGLVGEPITLPIPATPMHRVKIVDPAAELPGLAARAPDPETALVHVTATHVPGGPSRPEIIRAVRAAFPRHTEIVWSRVDAAGAEIVTGLSPQADHRATVRDYLQRPEVIPANDPDRTALLQLAESFLPSEGQP